MAHKAPTREERIARILARGYKPSGAVPDEAADAHWVSRLRRGTRAEDREVLAQIEALPPRRSVVGSPQVPRDWPTREERVARILARGYKPSGIVPEEMADATWVSKLRRRKRAEDWEVLAQIEALPPRRSIVPPKSGRPARGSRPDTIARDRRIADRYLGGASQREIAAEEGLSDGSAGQLILRARRRFDIPTRKRPRRPSEAKRAPATEPARARREDADRAIRAECIGAGCSRPPIARGMCRMHYSRVYAGKPLDPPSTPEPGDPIGRGRYGDLDDDGDTIGCHVCGRRLRALAGHVVREHGMTAREYKTTYGIPLRQGLVTRTLTEQHSAAATSRIGTPGWRRLEAARDPAAASAARDEVARAGMSRAIRGTDRPVINGRRARRPRVITCPLCGAQWCPLPGGYRRVVCSDACLRALVTRMRLEQPRPNAHRDADLIDLWRDGMTVRDLADEYGVTITRVNQILRRAANGD